MKKARPQKDLRTAFLLWYARHFLSPYLRLGIKTKVTKMILLSISRKLKKEKNKKDKKPSHIDCDLECPVLF